MRQFLCLLALSMFICHTPAVAKSLAGHWHTVDEEGADGQLTLDADGGFVLSWQWQEEPLRQTGVWQRRGDVVVFSRDPLEVGPTYHLLSGGPWNQEAEQKALSAARAAMEAQVEASCPWLPVPDVATAMPASDEQTSPAQAREALKEARLAAEALSVPAQRAAPDGGYVDRDAVRHAVAEAKRYAEAWRHAKAMYSAAGLALPNRPQPRVPDSCRPSEASVDPGLVAVHLVPSDGSRIDLSDDLTVAFRKPLGERQERLGPDNWSFTSGGENGPIEAVTFFGAGLPAETVRIPPEDRDARIFTIETDLQALANGPSDVVASIRDEALFIYSGAVRFVRSERRGEAPLQKEPRGSELRLRLTDAGSWPDAARARFLQASEDLHACSPGGVSMAPPPGRPAAPICDGKSDPESRFVAVEIGVPDGDVQPDGLGLTATTGDGERFESTSRWGGGALLAAASGTSLTRLEVTLPDGRSTGLELPEHWRDARYYRLTLPRAMLR